MEHTIFEETNHWIRFIRQWEREYGTPAPEKALDALEEAILKATKKYREKFRLDTDKCSH